MNYSNGVKRWFWIMLILLGIGTAKAAGHLFRFLILAAVGLCGMWMLHTLAGDFQKIRKGFSSARSLFRFKRDIQPFYDNITILQQVPPTPFINMDDNKMSFLDQSFAGILQQDPKGCVKSFVCQISAMNYTERNDDENTIMRLINLSSLSRYWPSMEFQKAIQIGKRKHNVKDCRNQYNSCPFKAATMLSILKMFKT